MFFQTVVDIQGRNPGMRAFLGPLLLGMIKVHVKPESHYPYELCELVFWATLLSPERLLFCVAHPSPAELNSLFPSLAISAAAPEQPGWWDLLEPGASLSHQGSFLQSQCGDLGVLALEPGGPGPDLPMTDRLCWESAWLLWFHFLMYRMGLQWLAPSFCDE